MTRSQNTSSRLRTTTRAALGLTAGLSLLSLAACDPGAPVGADEPVAAAASVAAPVAPSFEEQLTAAHPETWKDWTFAGTVPQRAAREGEVTDPQARPNVPAGEYLIMADGRMFRYTGTQPLPEQLFAGGPGSRGADATKDGAGGGAPGTLQQNIVIGTDDRSVMDVTATLQTWPYRSIGTVLYSSDATSGGCTATLIGPRHAVTAAHCLHDGAGTWFWPLFFSPGHKGTGADRTPNGAYRKVVARYARTYDAGWDYGLMILEDRPETASLGWLGFGWWSSDSFYQDRSIRVFGYPGADYSCADSPRADGKCGGFMYRSYCTIWDVTSDVLYHKCDTQKGNSGSAIQSYVGSDLYVLGVHKGSPESSTNYGPRFTQQKASVDLCGWIKNFPSAYATRNCN